MDDSGSRSLERGRDATELQCTMGSTEKSGDRAAAPRRLMMALTQVTLVVMDVKSIDA